MNGYRNIKVHMFMKYDIVLDEYVVSRRMATRTCIKKIGGVLIYGTGIEVRRSDIDKNGFTKIWFYNDILEKVEETSPNGASVTCRSCSGAPRSRWRCSSTTPTTSILRR
jgi:hypothetical protein